MREFAVRFKASALKELSRLPNAIQARVLDGVRLLAANPWSPLLPIRKMAGGGRRDLFRLRVGDYRVVYDVDRGTVVIHVIRVGHRKDVYR